MITTVSSKVVFNRIQKLFNPSDSSWRIDAKDYMGHKIKGIGYSVPGRKVKETVQVVDHVFKIPCDMKCIIGVEYNGKKLDRNTFVGAIIDKDKEEDEVQTNTDDQIKLKELADRYNTLYENYLSTKEAAILNNDTVLREEADNMKDTLDVILAEINQLIKGNNTHNIPKSSFNFYDIEPGYLITSFKNGNIKVHYVELPLDDEGLPLIVDNYNYIEALFWGVSTDLILSGYRHESFDWREAESKWNVFRKRANPNRTWTIDEAEQFTRMWLNYRFPQRAPQNFFLNDNIMY